MAQIQLSRPDKSGGWMIIKYTNGNYNHRMRVHVAPFEHADANLTYVTANGTEATVFDTFQSIVNLVKVFYDPTWAFSLQAVYGNMGADLDNAGFSFFQQIFGWAPPAAIAGTTGPATTAVNAAAMNIFNMNTLQGGRFRLNLLGAGGAGYALPQTFSANAGGNANEKIVSYLTGLNTGVRGRDGQKVTGSAHLTYWINRRLRRHYNQA